MPRRDPRQDGVVGAEWGVTVSRPPESPLSRRAARAHARRGSASCPEPACRARSSRPRPPFRCRSSRRRTGRDAVGRPCRRRDAPRARPSCSPPPTPRRCGTRARDASLRIAVDRRARRRRGAAARIRGRGDRDDGGSRPPPAATPTASAGRRRASPRRRSSRWRRFPCRSSSRPRPTADICALPDVVEALAAGDDEGVIAAAGGGEAFRAAVVEGYAPCITLDGSGPGLGRHQQDAPLRSRSTIARRRWCFPTTCATSSGGVAAAGCGIRPHRHGRRPRAPPAWARSRSTAASARTRRSSRRTAARCRSAASPTPIW